MRCFIAINLPEEMKEYLFGLETKIAKFFNNSDRYKFVEKDNLHLTLKFLGDIDEKSLKWITERLSNVNFESYEIILKDINVFKHNNKVRVIFVECESDKKTELLHYEIDNILYPKFSKDNRFKEHITLCRVKRIYNSEKFEKELKKIKVENKKFNVKSFYLMKSHLTKFGPRYYVIAKFNLEGNKVH